MKVIWICTVGVILFTGSKPFISLTKNRSKDAFALNRTKSKVHGRATMTPFYIPPSVQLRRRIQLYQWKNSIVILQIRSNALYLVSVATVFTASRPVIITLPPDHNSHFQHVCSRDHLVDNYGHYTVTVSPFI